MSPSIEIILIGCLVASAAAIPGTFLILRGMAMMSDAISHSVLLGIVLMFFVIKNIHSPWLIIAATLTGIITVALTEALIKTKQLKKDAAIGLIFPLFFALAIILISQFAANIHLDQDAVLLGEIAFAPFNRWSMFNIDLGPIGLWVMGTVCLINGLFTKLFYKELKISTFDAALATSLGISPILIHYVLMSLVSITAVTAFDIVGSILIVAFMVTPPATAYLLTHRLSIMIFMSMGIGCFSVATGYGLAIIIDGSIAGAMCSMMGLCFLIAFLFSSNHGVLHKLYRYRQQKLQFSSRLLTIQFLNHMGSNNEVFEHSIQNLVDHMQWSKPFSRKVMRYAIDQGYIIYKKNEYTLTSYGTEVAKSAFGES